MPSPLLNHGESALPEDGIERRSALQIHLPFPATVRGVDVTGERFEIDTVLDSFSAHGLYLRLARSVEPRAKLLIVIRLFNVAVDQGLAPCVALRGVVLRVEPRPDDRCGLSIAFRHHRFLYKAID